MADFTVCKNKLMCVSEQEEGGSRQLKKAAADLRKAANSSAMSAGSYAAVKAALHSLANDVQNEKKSMDQMREVLEEVMREYENTEKRIQDSYAKIKKMKDKIAQISSSIESIDWKEFGKDFSTRLVHVLEELGYSALDIAELVWDIPYGIGYNLSDGFENKDWGEKFKSWRDSFIPKHIHDETLMSAYNVLALMCPINNEIRALHKETNERVWEENSSDYTENGYIEHQQNMGEIRYGMEIEQLTKALGMRAYNGTTSTCEVIATYNALQHLSNNSHDSFADLVSYYEGNGCALYGYFGTSPDAIETYFFENDFDTAQLTGNKAGNADAVNELSQDYDTYIVTVYNDKDDINQQIHTMCITKDGSKYTIHNDYSGDGDGYTEYDVDSTTLNDVIADYDGGNGKTISLLGVKNK